MLCLQRGSRRRALPSVWRSVSNVGTPSGRLGANGNSVLRRRGARPHHILVLAITRLVRRATLWRGLAGKRQRKSHADVGPGTVVPSFRMVAQVLHYDGQLLITFDAEGCAEKVRFRPVQRVGNAHHIT